MNSLPQVTGPVEFDPGGAAEGLRRFRGHFYACLDARADELFELTDALLCAARPDAETSPERLFCHQHGRGRGAGRVVPGWPYSIVAALHSGRNSWTTVLDAVRLGPADDETAVSAQQLRDVVGRLIAAGHWQEGDPPIEVVVDCGYDVTRLAFLLGDLPVVLTARLRSDRVMAAPARRPPTRSPAGRPRTSH